MVRRNLKAASSRIANRSQACGQLLLMGMNDSEIIERSAHEPEVFGAIFDRHFDAIAGFCIRRVGNTDGEDIAGNVFRWAFENRERFDLAHGDARPWLFSIANNLVREARRSAGRQGRSPTVPRSRPKSQRQSMRSATCPSCLPS